MDRILIIEDEKPIREFIEINLNREKFQVFSAISGEGALSVLRESSIELVLLDITLSGMNGYEVLKIIKQDYPDTAVIMVTAKSQDMDKIMGLELGADDYICKPFNTQELIARIRSVLRRTKKMQGNVSSIVSDGDIKIDTEMHRVFKGNQPLELSPKEYELLLFMLKKPGIALTRNQLMDSVWGSEFYGDMKTVDVHIRKLREKIEKDASNPVCIETVWGVGYRWRNR